MSPVASFNFYVVLRPHVQGCGLLGTGPPTPYPAPAHSLQCGATSARGPPLTWLQHCPLGPRCQIRCGDTAELSLRMASCKSASSFPSVLIFFQGFFFFFFFFSLPAWHACICLISLRLALRLAFPGLDSQ